MIKKPSFFVLIGCALSMLSMSGIVGLSMSMIVASVFISSLIIPKSFWSTGKKIFFIAAVTPLLWVMSEDVAREFVTAFFMVVLSIKSTELSKPRDFSILAVFNLIAPVIALLQDPSPIIFTLGIASIIFSLVGLDSSVVLQKNNSEKVNYSFFIKNSIIAIPLMISVYLTAPRIDSPVWSMLMTRQTGVSDRMDLNFWGKLLKDPSTAFKVKFQDSDPPPSNDMYFKSSYLNIFTSNKWLAAYAEDNYTPLPDSGVLKYTVEFEKSNSKFAFFLGYPVSKPSGVDKKLSGGYQLKKEPEKGYMLLWSSARKAKHAPLTDEEILLYTDLPEDVAPKTKALAKEIRSKSSSEKDFANNLMKHFSSGYVYSLDISKPSKTADPTDYFTISKKSGFCMHYSSSMAIMARSVGIPARIVNGYAGGEYNENYVRVRKSDAHAWVELWIDGNWVLYDPTSVVPEARENDGLVWMVMKNLSSLSDKVKDYWNRWFILYDSKQRGKIIYEVTEMIKVNLKYLLLSLIVLAIINYQIKRIKQKPEELLYKVDEILNSVDIKTSGVYFKKRIELIYPDNHEIKKISEDIEKSIFSSRSDVRNTRRLIKKLKSLIKLNN